MGRRGNRCIGELAVVWPRLVWTHSDRQLFFGTPHTVPEHTPWESLIVKMLADSESVLDFQPFLSHLPSYAAQLETSFEAISGSYHIINFLAGGRRSPVARPPSYRLLDSAPDTLLTLSRTDYAGEPEETGLQMRQDCSSEL